MLRRFCSALFLNHDALHAVPSLLESFKKVVLSCRDAIITCIVNTLTCLLAGCVTFSILGHIAQEQQTQVSEVVKSGPGLVFLTYPEVVLKLPGAPLWAIIFFVMLLVRNCYSDDKTGSGPSMFVKYVTAIEGHRCRYSAGGFFRDAKPWLFILILRNIVECP